MSKELEKDGKKIKKWAGEKKRQIREGNIKREIETNEKYAGGDKGKRRVIIYRKSSQYPFITGCIKISCWTPFLRCICTTHRERRE
jgi:hypothetical protein